MTPVSRETLVKPVSAIVLGLAAAGLASLAAYFAGKSPVVQWAAVGVVGIVAAQCGWMFASFGLEVGAALAAVSAAAMKGVIDWMFNGRRETP